MIEITPVIALDEQEIKIDFVRAAGPGGQNVNKVPTAVQLRFDVRNSPSLPDDVRERLARLAGRRLTAAGELVIQTRRFRTQEQNRQDALNRLVELIRRAAEKPRPRRSTRPSPAVKERRLVAKRHRSEAKRHRRSVSDVEE
jgi:ribosome-associated protein